MTKIPAPLKFALLCGISLIVEWRALAATFSLALNREEYTQILLVLPIVAALVFLDRQVVEFAPKPGLRWGSALCVVSLTVAALAKWQPGLQPDAQLALDMLALVIWWAGAFVLCFGNSVARTFLFPLGFLLWMVPLPAFALARIIAFLQQWSAFAAQVLFNAAGVPVSQDGFFLTIPGLTRGCERMQQYPLQLAAGGHDHGVGSGLFALFLAKSVGCGCGNPIVCSQEWLADFHHRHAGDKG